MHEPLQSSNDGKKVVFYCRSEVETEENVGELVVVLDFDIDPNKLGTRAKLDSNPGVFVRGMNCITDEVPID